MTTLKERQLFESLSDKEYRDAFVDENITFGLAYQIRALREKNGWTQEELAIRTGKAQETISQLENPDYGKYTLKTLKTLASGFDLALLVSFISFRKLINRTGNLSPEVIAPPSYEEECHMPHAGVQGTSSLWQLDTDAALPSSMQHDLSSFDQIRDLISNLPVPGNLPPLPGFQSERVVTVEAGIDGESTDAAA